MFQAIKLTQAQLSQFLFQHFNPSSFVRIDDTSCQTNLLSDLLDQTKDIPLGQAYRYVNLSNWILYAGMVIVVKIDRPANGNASWVLARLFNEPEHPHGDGVSLFTQWFTNCHRMLYGDHLEKQLKLAKADFSKRPVKIYFSGPEVFYQNAGRSEVIEHIKSLNLGYYNETGMQELPLLVDGRYVDEDANVVEDEEDMDSVRPGIDLIFPENLGFHKSPQAIFKANCEAILDDQCAIVVANLCPWRGVIEPDSGTVFEVGLACAKNKIIHGWTNQKKSMREILEHHPDMVGNTYVEDFKKPTNLMLTHGCTYVHDAWKPAVSAACRSAIQLISDSCFASRRQHYYTDNHKALLELFTGWDFHVPNHWSIDLTGRKEIPVK